MGFFIGGDTIPKTQCVINFGLFDLTAKKDAAYSTTDMQPFVSLTDLKVEGYEIPNPLPFPGYSWDGIDLLDRSWDQIDAADLTWDEIDGADIEYAGYWSSSYSNRNGEFGTAIVEEFTWDDIDNADLTWDEIDAMDYSWSDLEGSDIPYLDIQFSEDHSSAGLTFKFATLYDEWCTEVEATWYDKDGLFVGYVKSRPSEVLHFAERKVENYRRIHIEFLGTNKPYETVKLTTIEFGVAQVLSGNDVISASIHEEISSISSQLFINTLDCKIQNDESNFYVLNTVGVFSLLQERQTLDVTVIKDDEHIPMGTFYLDSMENESKSVIRMQAIDLMGIIDKSDFQGGIYDNVTAGSLIAKIMESAKAEYILDSTLSGVRVSGYIPICSHREALQQVTFAIGAVATAARSDKIQIYPPKTYPTKIIPVSKKFYRKPVHLNEYISGAEVTAYTYANGSEQKDLLSGTLEAGDYEVSFTEPIRGITVNPAEVEIVESNANRALIRLARRYEVTLTGYPYIVQNRSYKKEASNLPASTSPNVQYVDSATLVSPDKAQGIANKLYEYAQKRHTHTFGMVNEGQMTGDVIQVQHIDGGQIIGTIEVIDTDLVKGFRSDITVNFAYLIENTVWDYAGEIWAGEEIGVL